MRIDKTSEKEKEIRNLRKNKKTKLTFKTKSTDAEVLKCLVEISRKTK